MAHYVVQHLHRCRVDRLILSSARNNVLSGRIFCTRIDFIGLTIASPINMQQLSVLRWSFTTCQPDSDCGTQYSLNYSTSVETLYDVVRHTLIIRIFYQSRYLRFWHSIIFFSFIGDIDHSTCRSQVRSDEVPSPSEVSTWSRCYFLRRKHDLIRSSSFPRRYESLCTVNFFLL